MKLKAAILSLLFSTSAFGDQFYVIQFQPGAAWEAGVVYEQQADIESHLEYWRGLYQREVLLMSGPFEGQSGGMFLVRVADQTAAETLVANDPGVQASKISATIQRWRVLTSAMRNAKPVVLEVEPEQSFNIKRLDPDSPINLPEN